MDQRGVARTAQDLNARAGAVESVSFPAPPTITMLLPPVEDVMSLPVPANIVIDEPPVCMIAVLPAPPTITALVSVPTEIVSLPVPPTMITLLPPVEEIMSLPVPAKSETFLESPALRWSLPAPPTSAWNVPVNVMLSPAESMVCVPCVRLTFTPVEDEAKLRVLFCVPAVTTSPVRWD